MIGGPDHALPGTKGSERRRWPVAANKALAMAGADDRHRQLGDAARRFLAADDLDADVRRVPSAAAGPRSPRLRALGRPPSKSIGRPVAPAMP